jgi:hypothetical protein
MLVMCTVQSAMENWTARQCEVSPDAGLRNRNSKAVQAKPPAHGGTDQLHAVQRNFAGLVRCFNTRTPQLVPQFTGKGDV